MLLLLIMQLSIAKSQNNTDPVGIYTTNEDWTLLSGFERIQIASFEYDT